MFIERDISTPPAFSHSWTERWEGSDKGLICAWLCGIEKSKSDSSFADKAKRGELPITPYKGGIDKAIKAKSKIGALHYIAYWQGLRGENLRIDTDSETAMTCSRTGVTILYTGDTNKLLLAEDEQAT